ncbi:MAG: hypothetical protein EOP58_13435 [Sphingomonadales bacterium]|nr:MAG: hypothetical protein EOP58_13435 [Sphingomonadales bacterium]
MDQFEFVFSLVSLLLGLTLTEIAGGLASALKARKRISIGWITPLATLLICLDIVTMWPSLWHMRDTLDVRTLPLILASLMCLGYYVAASFVFPDTFEDGISLDDWYFENRWFSIGGTLLLAFVFQLIQRGIEHQPAYAGVGDFFGRNWGWGLYIAQYMLALLTRRRWLIIADFCGVLLMYVVYYWLNLT